MSEEKQDMYFGKLGHFRVSADDVTYCALSFTVTFCGLIDFMILGADNLVETSDMDL